jgi:hypothetical protein
LGLGYRRQSLALQWWAIKPLGLSVIVDRFWKDQSKWAISNLCLVSLCFEEKDLYNTQTHELTQPPYQQ